jgi:hypothetical protein
MKVATAVARNTNGAMVVGSGGICVWRESGMCSGAVGFMLMFLAGIWLQSPFTLIYFFVNAIHFVLSMRFAKTVLQ